MTWEQDIRWLAETMGLLPCRTFCECAVGPLEISHTRGFIGYCNKLIIIEPNPQLAAAAEDALKNPVIRAAIDFESHQTMMMENGGSSYLRGTWAPTPTNGAVIPVDAVTFDTLDDGEIDVMVLDCEGMEWAVLSNMRSRPELLAIEIWEKNPYKTEILNWLEENDYKLRLCSGPTGEGKIYTQRLTRAPFF